MKKTVVYVMDGIPISDFDVRSAAKKFMNSDETVIAVSSELFVAQCRLEHMLRCFCHQDRESKLFIRYKNKKEEWEEESVDRFGRSKGHYPNIVAEILTDIFKLERTIKEDSNYKFNSQEN